MPHHLPKAYGQEDAAGGTQWPSSLFLSSASSPCWHLGLGTPAGSQEQKGGEAIDRKLLLAGVAWSSLAWQEFRAGSFFCGCICELRWSPDGPSPPFAPGSALTPPQRRPHLRCLRTVSLPSAPRLWAKETLTPFSPLCGRGKTSIAGAMTLPLSCLKPLVLSQTELVSGPWLPHICSHPTPTCSTLGEAIATDDCREMMGE